MQELFIGFNLNPNDGELFLKEARYDDLHNCFSIIISLDNGNDWIDVFTYESNYGNEIPPNPISLPSGKDAIIYDLQGRRVTTPQKNGLYIKNGKKYLMK